MHPSELETRQAITTIGAEAARFPVQPFLLSVSADGRPHCIPVSLTWSDATILVRAPSQWAAGEARGHRQVSILWSAPRPGDYSLIVDGVAQKVAETDQLSIRPTRAVLHRSGPAPEGGPSGCASDCVPVWSA